VIYDSVGGEITDQSLKCIAWNGRLVIIGFASGEIPAIKANRILLKNIAVTGLHWSAYARRSPSASPTASRRCSDCTRAARSRR
jgi:NADPH2:quinone reductase